MFEEAMRLRQELVRLLESDFDHPEAGPALWALGKLYDPALRPLFERALHHHLERNANVLYQAIIALNNLGVEFPEAHGAFAFNDVERNRAMAKAHLARS